VTAGTKVTLLQGENATPMKASKLSGQPGLLYRRNSLTGAVEVIPRTGSGVELNEALHS
jgi:2,3,4,5-tetrahydropyridine-2-carboxylate N-succinyltransferase